MGQIPIVQTPDSKQWVDLDILSPKVLNELRRQYDPSLKSEPTGTLAKSAAKVKAWVRQNKVGVDIRLRRRVSAGHDEVTDIHLVPDQAIPSFQRRNEKPFLISELEGELNQIPAGLPREVNELPDTSVLPELSAARHPSRNSTASSTGEPLPRYEPRSEESDASNPANRGAEGSPSPNPTVMHRPSSSENSILATPTRGLSLRDSASAGVNDEPAVGRGSAEVKTYPESDTQPSGDDTANPDKTNRDHGAERQLPGSIQEIIRALQEKLSEKNAASEATPATGDSLAIKTGLNRLKVTDTTSYETETDAEPPSPSQRTTIKPGHKRMAATPKREKSVPKRGPSTAGDLKTLDDSDDDTTTKASSLIRKQTLPRRLPATAGAEAIWTSLLRMQAKILGPEHPMTYQAKSDLAQSRANGHVLQYEDLAALRKSRNFAVQTLGSVHPWVAAFSEDLKMLERLAGTDSRTNEEDIDVAAAETSPEGPEKIPESDLSEVQPEDTKAQGRTLSPPLQSELRLPSDVQRDALPKINVNVIAPENGSPPTHSPQPAPKLDALWDLPRAPHKSSNQFSVLPSLVFGAAMNAALKGIVWLQHTYGPEKDVEPGKTRVRWTCSCGEELYDDFIERRVGAARELEAYLNRPKAAAGGGGTTPISPSSSSGNGSFANSSFGAPPSTQTSWSSAATDGMNGAGSLGSKWNTNLPYTSIGASLYTPYSPSPEPPWLLTCTNEDRYTPKLAHLDMAPHKITSDKILALALREHYYHVNKKWWRSLRVRGLTTIEFVQFEVHQNRFTDIRKCPDMPPLPTCDYYFEPGDLMPPVGSQYLMHLFRHPQDYDTELITYLRAPKRTGRLHMGVGWGINLVEGFLADRVWMVVSAFFALGSLAFVVAWACTQHDIQGASGIAAWILALSTLTFGWLQTWG
ncbi:hypothetical protein LTR37_009486 [Vermiconidia calcicola]|uniref:Uncharacterized protein n=1 Tax=Vermiconidia calcicola TaxID=1690605 RepID=A0ACC3N7Y5_9PEZI|nr:hypothetical protein LTR37_009486 [Vermiconidia calcicola]